MIVLNLSYNGNENNEYYLLPEGGTKSDKFVNGVNGVIDYIETFPDPVDIKFSKNPNENRFPQEDRNALVKLVKMHNQREHILDQIKKTNNKTFTPSQ